METASAVFVPRSKRWWTSSRRRRSGYHYPAFRENYSYFLLAFGNPFNFLLQHFHHSCSRPEVLRDWAETRSTRSLSSCFSLTSLYLTLSYGVKATFSLLRPLSVDLGRPFFNLPFFLFVKRCRFFLLGSKRLLVSFPLHVFVLSPGPSWDAAFLSSPSSIL